MISKSALTMEEKQKNRRRETGELCLDELESIFHA